MTTYAGAADLTGTGTLTALARRISGSVWQLSGPALARTWSATASAVGGKLYVFGGFAWEVSGSSRWTQMYDPVLNTWERKADLSDYRTEGFATTVGGYIYMGGGWSGGAYTSALWRYDPTLNTWTSLAAIPGGGVRVVGCGDEANSKIYVFTLSGLAYVHTYDIATDTWSTAGSTLGIEWQACVMHSNGKVYLHGTSAGSFYEYNPATATFTAKAGEWERHYPAMISFDGLIWVAGGAGVSTYDDTNTSVKSYDPATNAWTTRDDLVQRRIGPTGGVVGGHMMVIGGWSLAEPSVQIPYWSSTTATAPEIYVLPVTSAAQLTMGLDLYPGMLADATLTFEFPLTGEARVDPRRLNPGFLKTGHRPPGYRDPADMIRVFGSEMPLPAVGDTDIFGEPITEDLDELDEYAYVSDGQYFYVITGYWGNVEQWWSNRIYRYDAVSGEWTELAHLPGFVGSEGAKAGLIDGKIYVLMGDTGRSPDGRPFCAACVAPDAEFNEDDWMLQSMWVYDIDANTWTRGPQPPFRDSYGAATVLDGKLYYAQMYGVGWDESTGFAMFDPSTDVWTTLADQIFTPYDSPALWAGDGKVWTTNWDNNADHLYLASYDPATDTWTDETANFDGFTVFFDAAAVIPLSDTVVRLMGGNDGDSIAYDIDVVAKTVISTGLRWPIGTTSNDWGYYGGFQYNGVTYTTGPRNGTIQFPVSIWRTP